MKLDYLSEGSDLCPLLRLYDFTAPEALQLLAAARQLASSAAPTIAIHELPYVEATENCSLTWRVANDDRGILAHGGGVFTCELSTSGWLDLAALIEPFVARPKSGYFQWLLGGLNTDHSPSLLLSTDGQW